MSDGAENGIAAKPAVTAEE